MSRLDAATHHSFAIKVRNQSSLLSTWKVEHWANICQQASYHREKTKFSTAWKKDKLDHVRSFHLYSLQYTNETHKRRPFAWLDLWLWSRRRSTNRISLRRYSSAWRWKWPEKTSGKSSTAEMMMMSEQSLLPAGQIVKSLARVDFFAFSYLLSSLTKKNLQRTTTKSKERKRKKGMNEYINAQIRSHLSSFNKIESNVSFSRWKSLRQRRCSSRPCASFTLQRQHVRWMDRSRSDRGRFR